MTEKQKKFRTITKSKKQDLADDIRHALKLLVYYTIIEEDPDEAHASVNLVFEAVGLKPPIEENHEYWYKLLGARPPELEEDSEAD